MSAGDFDHGWCLRAKRVPSPNFDERPAGQAVTLLVIHGISLPPGEYGGPWIDDFFTNRLDAGQHPYFNEIRDLCVSSHFLIRRDGELVQYVPVDMRAWHAGDSCYQGRSACNDYSIGIELEGIDDEPYEPAQYESLVELTAALCRQIPTLDPQHIVGHVDIAPARKTDPGEAFDWAGFRKKLQQKLAS